MKTTKVSKAEYEILAALRYALRQFLHFSEAVAHSAGITPQQHQALLAIKGFPGRERITISELAERLQLRHHSAVGLAARIVSAGLVVRERDELDRRRIYLALSPQGDAVLERLSAAHKEQLRRVGPEIELLLKRFQGDVPISKTKSKFP